MSDRILFEVKIKINYLMNNSCEIAQRIEKKKVKNKKKKCELCKRKITLDVVCLCGKYYCKYHIYPDHLCINRKLRQQNSLKKKLVKFVVTHNFEKLE